MLQALETIKLNCENVKVFIQKIRLFLYKQRLNKKRLQKTMFRIRIECIITDIYEKSFNQPVIINFDLKKCKTDGMIFINATICLSPSTEKAQLVLHTSL